MQRLTSSSNIQQTRPATSIKSYGEFPQSVKIHETVTFVGGDLHNEIEFNHVDSADSGSDGDEIDDIDGV
jgi:translation initiation factor 1A